MTATIGKAVRGVLAAVLPLVLAAAVVTALPAAAWAAGGPSVELPTTGSTPVGAQTMTPRGADPAALAELHGDQPAGSAPDGGGTSKASPLAPSATWDVSTQTGDFSWSYPLRVPPAPGGFTPRLGLTYSSSAVDGRTSATNNQASWVGDGWDLSVGFVERRYLPCAADTTGGTTPSDKVGDLCWRSDNAVASYGSKAGELIRDDATGTWRPKSDDGSRVERLSGSGNGARDGEYWRITTVDGTQYLYGSRPDSGSTWTVPVYGDDAGEPCHQATFDASSCTQAWRWNLDKVVDRNGNVIVYGYTKETNSYGANAKDAAVSYTRGGTLASAEYGLRDGSTAKATGRVDFAVADRCVPGSDCVESKKDNWPDVSWADKCAAATCEDQHGPSFWSSKRLASVTTKVLSGTTYKDVESWTLDQQFPSPGDGEKAALWLKGVTHTGLAGATPITLPAVSFTGAKFPNRVGATDGSGMGPLNRYRVTGVVSEAGGVLSVNYARPDCTTAPAKAETNTQRCFPATWAKKDFAERTDYFQKYVVESVVQSDRISTNPEQVTSYEYLDGAAWAYDTSEFTKDKNRTWNEYRGFGKVRIRQGRPDDPSGPVTMTEEHYYRGMNGDKQPSGTRSVSVTDSAGGSRVDDQWLQGTLFESRTHDGTGEGVVAKSITTPVVTGPTAKRGEFTAYRVAPGVSTSYTALAAGGWRTTREESTYDEFGQVVKSNDLGDTATSADDTCTTTTYNRNTDAWLMTSVATTETVAKACGQAPVFPADAISASRYAYDGKGFADRPTAGNATRTEVLDQRPAGSTAPVYALASTAVFDVHGRATSAGDALGNITTTAYTPTTGGPVTGVTTTNAKQHTTSTVVETAFGQPVTQTDANQRKTTTAYDALGRKTEVWLANRDPATQSGNQKFSYAYHTDAPSVVTTSALGPNGNYTTSNQLYDGLLRPRQVQQPAFGGGRLIVDTRYDTQGRAYKTTKPYFTDSPVDDELWVASDVDIPSQEVTSYDGAGRPVASVTMGGAHELWRTTTAYRGDRVDVTPPKGGIATTTVSDARGQTTELRQYHGPKPEGAADSTTYTYTPAGALASVTDPVGTTWRRTYDLRGRKVRDEDPDKGVTTMTYDNAGRLETTTDAKNSTLAFDYDVLGRKTAMRSGSKTGPVLADWTYDTVLFAKGRLATSTRYVNGKAYRTSILGYSALYSPTGKSVTIPDTEQALGKTYTSYTKYNVDESVSSTAFAAIGSLPAEATAVSRNDFGSMTSATSGFGGADVHLVSDVQYTRYGETQRLQLGDEGKRVWLSRYYDANTRRLDRTVLDAEVPAPMQADTHYSYDDAGNVTSIADTPLGQVPDVQCFTTDYLQRVTEAWTPTGGCDAQPTAAGLGGPAPYWQSFTYDKVGNRRTETRHTTSGDMVRTYAYPAPTEARPHTLTSVTSTTPAGTTTDTFAYNEIGQTTTRKTGGVEQKLDWDGEGHVTKVTEAGKTTEYLYDANGNRLIRRDPTGTTLYLDGEELKLTTSGALEPTRYYAFGRTTVAIRDKNGLSWVAGDEQGTSQVSVKSDTLDVTRRRQAPFGAPRGATTAFPGQKGFVGGTVDASTGLVGIGARLYDAAVGRFLSADPLLDVDDPQQMQGYSYADNNPITKLDPSGLGWFDWVDDAAGWVADRAVDAVKWADDHTGTIGLALGVAGMALTPGGWVFGAVMVAGLLVNGYDAYKAARDHDDVGFGLAIAGFVTGGAATVAGKVVAGVAGEGAEVALNLTGQAAGSASAGIAEAKNIQTAREAPAKEAEARKKAAKEHADNLAADIDRMLSSGCPSMKGVVPLPGPCPLPEGQPDPMENKFCSGGGENFLGCMVFGGDWRRPSYNVPVPKCYLACWGKGSSSSWNVHPQKPKPRVPRNDPYPQYSGYHTPAYLDMKYR